MAKSARNSLCRSRPRWPRAGCSREQTPSRGSRSPRFALSRLIAASRLPFCSVMSHSSPSKGRRRVCGPIDPGRRRTETPPGARSENARSLRLCLANPIDSQHRQGNRRRSKPRQTGPAAMQPWFIPMFYVIAAVLGGLALPRIRAGLLFGLRLRRVRVLGAGLPFGRGVGDDGVDRDRVRHGLRYGAIQRHRLFAAARALVCARSHDVSCAGRVHGDLRLCPVHARLGGPRRSGEGPAVFDGARGHHDHCQHAHVCAVDAAPRRPSDRQRASSRRRSGARRDRRDVPAP